MAKRERKTLSRRASILEILGKYGEISIDEISKRYNISEVSVRNDLSYLENKGLLIRIRGGAIKQQQGNFDLSFNQKLKRNYREKRKIGRKAIEYIKEGDTLMLDSGSTTLEIAKNLRKFKKLTIITNSLPIASQVSDYEGIEVIVPGGALRSEMRSLVGSQAEKNIRNYHCNKMFLAADGISSEFGISTPVVDEAALASAMIEVSDLVILVSDSSKFQRTSKMKIAPIDSIDILITDGGISEEVRLKFEKFNLELVIV